MSGTSKTVQDSPESPAGEKKIFLGLLLHYKFTCSKSGDLRWSQSFFQDLVYAEVNLSLQRQLHAARPKLVSDVSHIPLRHILDQIVRPTLSTPSPSALPLMTTRKVWEHHKGEDLSSLKQRCLPSGVFALHLHMSSSGFPTQPCDS